MRPTFFVLLALLLLTSACGNPIPSEPSDAVGPTAHTSAPNADVTVATPASEARRDQPLQVSIPLTPTPIPNDAAGAFTGPDHTVGHGDDSFHDHSFHEHDDEPAKPLPWPDPPAPDSDPLEVATFVGTVITNTSPTNDSDPPLLDRWLTPSLATDIRLASVSSDATTSPASVLIDASVIADTQTTHQTEIRLLFEQTHTEAADFIQVTALLVINDDGQWVVAELTVSNR